MASIALPYPHQLTFRPFQPWLWLHIAALLLLNFGALALVIILHDLRWLALIVLLPFVGALIYWGMRKPSQDEIDQHMLGEAELRRSAASRPFDSTGL